MKMRSSGQQPGRGGAVATYVRSTHGAVLTMDLLRVLLSAASAPLALAAIKHLVLSHVLDAPLHRRLIAEPDPVSVAYALTVMTGAILTALSLTTALRNFVAIALQRANITPAGPGDPAELALPSWPYSRESFALILGELQDRDGSPVPNDRSPDLRPRWLILPELALYTGVFVTGGIGTGKTSAVAYPALDQFLGFRRSVPVRKRDGSIEKHEWKFSGLILDEKGDFTRTAARYCRKWQRDKDLIRISPGGEWIWNVVYNPNLPTWAVGYQLGWIIRNFNKGQTASDPFWDNAPRELVTEYLGLLDDAESYYTLHDYLEVLIDDSKQDKLHATARIRHAADPERLDQIERRWRSIQRRRVGMGINLRGSLEACARAGIDMFRQPELRRTFCPTRQEYFEPDGTGNVRPRANVFTGFDQILDAGKIVGLEMPKQIFFDAAIFCQVALKAQWQDAVLRRETIGPDGRLLVPPRFGEEIGYCPTFLMADEAQLSATPRDAEFKAVCRSKRASMWELTQSHSSIKSAFGPQKAADAATYFQNSMTHIYLRQSDPDSMRSIQDEIGKKVVPRTTVAVTEGGQSSALSYFQGDLVHQSMGISSMKSVSTEEKPFLEVEELKTLPNNVAVVCPSNGHRTLPATITYLRPLFVFENDPTLRKETPWFRWPEALRSTYDLHDIPQTIAWGGWKTAEGRAAAPLEEAMMSDPDSRLGRFVQTPVAPSSEVEPALQEPAQTDPSPEGRHAVPDRWLDRLPSQTFEDEPPPLPAGYDPDDTPIDALAQPTDHED
jgi:hypothetical protein